MSSPDSSVQKPPFDDQSLAAQFQALSAEDREQRLKLLSPEELEALNYNWAFWARPSQMLPQGHWLVWLILAGRGFGKTRTGAETVRHWIKSGVEHVNIIGATADDVRDIMVDGESGILAVCPKDERPEYVKSQRKLVWPNGAKSLLFTADEPDRLRGKQHAKTWCLLYGTMVASRRGSVALGTLTIEDEVWTRNGWRKVTGLISHKAAVGRVKFSNGAELIGTADHPVMTATGWKNLGELCSTDKVLTGGPATSGGISVLTLAQETGSVKPRSYTSIDGFGNKKTGRYHQATSSTTKTATAWITGKEIASVFLKVLTLGTIFLTNLFQELTTQNDRQISEKNALRALLKSSQGSVAGLRCAVGVLGSEVRKIFAKSRPAWLARQNSELRHTSTGNSAVGVAVTWQELGFDTVYNLSVDQDHEYYANGILTHNCDEIAAWRYLEEAWAQMVFGLRLGNLPQCVATSTPRPVPTVRALIKESTTHLTTGTTYANKANLAQSFVKELIKKYEGTRLGRQELNAEMLEDVPGALWTRQVFEDNRIGHVPVELKRIVVAVDPSVSSNMETSNETGLVVAGLGTDNIGYVLDDLSKVRKPLEWATIAVSQYTARKADVIVGEKNNGGELVESTVRMVDPNVNYKGVHASKGKYKRAEPIAALYEQGRIKHVGAFPQLEDQCATYVPNDTSQVSPDRMDAMVWAFTELFVDEPAAGSGQMPADQWKVWQGKEPPKCVEVTVSCWAEPCEEGMDMGAAAWGVFWQEEKLCAVLLETAQGKEPVAVCVEKLTALVKKHAPEVTIFAKGAENWLVKYLRKNTAFLVKEMQYDKYLGPGGSAKVLKQGLGWRPDLDWAKQATWDLQRFPYGGKDGQAHAVALGLLHIARRHELGSAAEAPQEKEERRGAIYA